MASKRRQRNTQLTKIQSVPPRQKQIEPRGLSKRAGPTATILIFLLHILALAFCFNPLTASINDRPLINQDWGLHFHHLKSLETFWRQDKVVWGYNPFFMAGYPSNTIQDLSIKLFEFLSVALSTVLLSPVRWLKILAFLAMASTPWTMYFAGRNFFYRAESKNLIAGIAALLATVYWWNSLPREMFFYGMIGFPVASYLSILAVSLFYRLVKQAPFLGSIHIGLFIVALIILPLHVQSLISFLPPAIALFVIERRFFTVRLWMTIIVIAALSLIMNSPWLIPAFAHRGDDISEEIVRQLPLFASSDPLTFLKDYLGPTGYWTFRPSFLEKGFRFALLILGALGTWKLIRSDKRDLGILVATGWVVLFSVSYFGGLIPLTNSWQPLRFKIPYDLFLVVGASYSIGEWFSTRLVAHSRVVPALLIAGLIAFLVNLFHTESSGKLQLGSRFGPELNRIAEWIQRETSTEGRVLFEESGDETGFVYDGVYLSSFLPHLAGRQLIGGPINLYNDRHHFAEFHSGKLFKKDIRTLFDEELRNYLRLYNIGAVVAFHPASIKRLLSMTGLVTLEQHIGPVHLMKVHQRLSWFIEGEGEVNAGFNRLTLSGLKGKEVILKYHWIDGLTSRPAAKIVPVNMADDPIPFIKIVEPPPALTLRVGS